MRLPMWLLRLLPMWDYICPRCRNDVPKNSVICPHCCELYGTPLHVPPRVLKDPFLLEQYVHQVIIPNSTPAMRDFLTQYFTVIFWNGFEEGSFSAWTGTTLVGGGTATAITARRHHGLYSAEFVKSLNTDSARCYKTFTSVAPLTTFSRGYFYLVSVDMGDNNDYEYLMSHVEGTTTRDGVIIRNLAASGTASLLLIETTGFHTADSGIDLSTGVWYCIELATPINAGASILLFLNGTQVATLAENTSTWTINRLDVGWGRSAVSAIHAGTLDADDVVLADARIGCLEPFVRERVLSRNLRNNRYHSGTYKYIIKR